MWAATVRYLLAKKDDVRPKSKSAPPIYRFEWWPCSNILFLFSSQASRAPHWTLIQRFKKHQILVSEACFRESDVPFAVGVQSPADVAAGSPVGPRAGAQHCYDILQCLHLHFFFRPAERNCAGNLKFGMLGLGWVIFLKCWLIFRLPITHGKISRVRNSILRPHI